MPQDGTIPQWPNCSVLWLVSVIEMPNVVMLSMKSSIFCGDHFDLLPPIMWLFRGNRRCLFLRANQCGGLLSHDITCFIKHSDWDMMLQGYVSKATGSTIPKITSITTFMAIKHLSAWVVYYCFTNRRNIWHCPKSICFQWDQLNKYLPACDDAFFQGAVLPLMLYVA